MIQENHEKHSGRNFRNAWKELHDFFLNELPTKSCNVLQRELLKKSSKLNSERSFYSYSDQKLGKNLWKTFKRNPKNHRKKSQKGSEKFSENKPRRELLLEFREVLCTKKSRETPVGIAELTLL